MNDTSSPYDFSRRAQYRAQKLRIAGAMLLTASLAASGAMSQTPIPPSAADYAIAAAQSDQYEIQAGRVAIAQSHNPRIQAFARDMIADHTRTSEDLAKAAEASGLPSPPPSMSGDQTLMLAALQSQTGDEFDHTYIKQQVLAHDQALAVSRSYAAGGTDTNLRNFAKSITSLIQRHLGMANQIKSALNPAP
jgi:putative membrane protein